jgi:hypothetical protein
LVMPGPVVSKQFSFKLCSSVLASELATFPALLGNQMAGAVKPRRLRLLMPAGLRISLRTPRRYVGVTDRCNVAPP